MTILDYKDVKIRKERHCCGCARKFEKGSTLNFVKSVDGGEFNSAYWCKTCSNYWNKYMDNGDEVGFGELKSEDFERWEEIRKEIEN